MNLATILTEAIANRIGLRAEFSRPKVEAFLSGICAEDQDAWVERILNARANSKEWLEFAELFLVHETYFFRHSPQLQFLAEGVLPALLEDRIRSGRPQFRAWCAGCSSGEEAYSLGLLLNDVISRLPVATPWDIAVIGTDLSPDMILRAQSGEYKASVGLNSFRDVPAFARHHFSTVLGDGKMSWSADDTLRKTVTFQRRNLLEDPAPFGDIDLILCRNTLIYFEESKAQAILLKMETALRPEGVLVLGPANTLRNTSAFTLLTDNRAMFWKKKGNHMS